MTSHSFDKCGLLIGFNTKKETSIVPTIKIFSIDPILFPNLNHSISKFYICNIFEVNIWMAHKKELLVAMTSTNFAIAVNEFIT